MTERADAKLTRYQEGGYLLTLPDGSEYEVDTQAEAFKVARDEGATRIYSTVKPGQFVQLVIED